MIKKLIMVGTTTQNNKFVNGQSMMFQLFADHLHEKNIKTSIVDFGRSVSPHQHKKRVSGKFDIFKLVDNFLLFFHFLFVLVRNPRTMVYINTSQSRVGFVRDYFFVNLAKFLNHKIVIHQFGANYGNFYNSQSLQTQKMIKRTLSHAEVIVVEGDYTKRQFSFLQNYSSKVIPLTNGLPEKINYDGVSPKRIESNEPLELLYLSNLIEGKGYWDVLEAMDILVNQHQLNINAVFSGRFLKDEKDEKFVSSSEAKQFFNQFVEENIKGRVKHTEGLFGEQKSAAFSKAHFFLLPTYYINEGQPVSVLEALAYGCVPIVTAYRLIPDMVNLDNGIFVNPKSPHEIANVIINMMENPYQYERLSKQGLHYYKQNFTAEIYVTKLLDLINATNTKSKL